MTALALGADLERRRHERRVRGLACDANVSLTPAPEGELTVGTGDAAVDDQGV